MERVGRESRTQESARLPTRQAASLRHGFSVLPGINELRGKLAVSGVWVVLLLAGCGVRSAPVRVPEVAPGDNHFGSYCAACHQYDGQGVGEAPPLDGSSWVAGPETRLIRIVLHGVQGAIEVKGRTYDREMPGFGQIMSDAEIASLLSFVRRRFAGLSEPVTAATVSRVRVATPDRADYWTVDELSRGR